MSGEYNHKHYVPKKCECMHKDKRHEDGTGPCDVRDCGCQELKEKK